jgi:hypothetical protein
MSSPQPGPGGSVVTVSEAIDLLHKFATESTKVQALLVTSDSGNSSLVSGVVRSGGEGRIGVIAGNDRKSPLIEFTPARATLIRYGDERALPAKVLPALEMFKEEFVSALTFVFPDSFVGIFECRS